MPIRPGVTSKSVFFAFLTLTGPTEHNGECGVLSDSYCKITPTTFVGLFPLDLLIFHWACMKDARLILKFFIIFRQLFYLIQHYTWPFFKLIIIRKIEHEGKAN